MAFEGGIGNWLMLDLLPGIGEKNYRKTVKLLSSGCFSRDDDTMLQIDDNASFSDNIG